MGMRDENMLTLGSLFDGIGGFCLAAERHGIRPIWSSEIDEACQRVTAKHFPDCIQLGDITKINGAEIPPVDIIAFGSPCQDLSIAGKKKGLAGERSGLFLRAIDIIRCMRSATNGRYPSIIVWENVPGAFSSNNGDDFRVVLEEIAETEIPMPEGGKWATCGVVQCDDREICWRVLDAQYWGVAQRRKRIFLVTSFGDKCAKEILLEQEGLRGDSAESERQGQEITANIRKGTNRADRMDRAYTMQLRAGASGGGKGALIQDEKSATLKATNMQTLFVPCVLGGNNCINPMDSQHNRLYTTDGPSPCLRAGTESIGQIPKIVCEK